MEWLNLHTATLDSPEVIGSDPVERGTWLMLLRYCIGQENGGIIENCRDWKDRRWQQLVRVTKKEVEIQSDLWTWQNDRLIVTHYPCDKEREIKHLRAIGKSQSMAKKEASKANGAKGGRPAKNPTGNPTETDQETHAKPIEGKGREGEGEWNSVFIHTAQGGEHRRPTIEQAKAAASQIGISPEMADEWWNTRESADWTKGQPGGSTVSIGANWQADLKTYAARMAQSNADRRPKHRQGEFPEHELRNLKLPRL